MRLVCHRSTIEVGFLGRVDRARPVQLVPDQLALRSQHVLAVHLKARLRLAPMGCRAQTVLLVLNLPSCATHACHARRGICGLLVNVANAPAARNPV